MIGADSDRLKNYINLITKKRGGIEAAIESLPRSTDGAVLETTGGLERISQPSVSEAARRGMETVATGGSLSEAESFGLEAIINADLRPAIDIVGGTYQQVTHHLWTHLSSDVGIRQRLENVIPSVGRIELPGNRRYPYGGTGFVVGDGLIMTNRHVAEIFARGLGTRVVGFKPGLNAGLNFLRERGGAIGTTLSVRHVVMIHPYWDMAILAVENLPLDHPPLRLSLADVGDLDGHEIAVIGYPAFDPRNNAAEQDKLFDSEYGFKRLQPGELHGRTSAESFGKIVSPAAHDCSTLGGNSGSCVVDLANGEILALHFGGRYHEKNFAVPSFELARDGRVVDCGVSFAGSPTGGSPAWSDWWSKADLVEIGEEDAVGGDGAGSTPAPAPPTGRAVSRLQTASDEITIEIPLQITVRLGAPAADDKEPLTGGETADGGGDIVEALVEPWRDSDYVSRSGYDAYFLGIEVPMPKPADESVLAKTRDGRRILDYQNFSVAMHGSRRLALFTASNVSADPTQKRPDPRKKYTRRALSGLGKNDQERWFLDPRLDDKFQLPDVFFTRDRRAFDKGHIVRRDDVAWGATYDELRRANGDTYHVTNCSPQVAEYNRSGSGKDNWGDLENHVLSTAASQRLAVFAGPVLAPDDEVFLGAGGGRNKIRAKIPSRFWKVIVANTADGLAAFGFVLEQDLAAVEFEFVVPSEFVPFTYQLPEIEAMTGIRFPSVVRDADQYETVRGTEIAMHSGARRR